MCKTYKRNAIHFGGIAVRGEDQRFRKAAVMLLVFQGILL
jgi:hypothetical protein